MSHRRDYESESIVVRWDSARFASRAPEAARDRLEADTPAAFTPNPRVPDPRAAERRAG